MSFRFRMLDPKVKSNPRPYVLQCSLAFFALLVVLLVEEVGLHRVVMIAAIGSTSFVLFVTPHSSTANPRHVIGGHLVALLVGSAFAVFSGTPVGQNLLTQVPLVLDVEAALAVALSIFLWRPPTQNMPRLRAPPPRWPLDSALDPQRTQIPYSLAHEHSHAR